MGSSVPLEKHQGETLGASHHYLYELRFQGFNSRKLWDDMDDDKGLYNKIGIIWWI